MTGPPQEGAGPPPKTATTKPFVSLIALAVLLVAAVVLILVEEEDVREQHIVVLIGVLAVGAQTAIAAIFSERASRDIRNGVVSAKARQGATEAIRSEGVTVRGGPAVISQLAAQQAEMAALRLALDEHRIILAEIRAGQRPSKAVRPRPPGDDGPTLAPDEGGQP